MRPDLTGIMATDAISPMAPSKACYERGWGMVMLPDTIIARADHGILA